MEYKTIGMAAGIYFQSEKPLNLLVVPNVKTETAIAEFLRENQHPSFRDRQERNRWVRTEWERLGIKSPKPDKLGLPGGEIWDFEVALYPKEYAEVAAGREIAEETGKAPKAMRLIGSGPLFQPDRDGMTGGYENHFFLVLEAEGNLNTKGYPGETGPPLFKSVTELQPWNFYPKHAVPLIKVITEFVEAGRTEYIPVLEHLQKAFAGKMPELREKPDFRPTPPSLPENMTAEELFAAAMRQLGVKK